MLIGQMGHSHLALLRGVNMRKILLTIAFILLAFPVFGANHYILDGGTGDGSAWNNALDNLPSSLTRGDTYYIGDGAYGNYTFDDAVSGTSVITIKKSTVADHGTETGYAEADHNGQATFGVLTIRSGYYTIDGATRTDSNWQADTYGFKIAGSGVAGNNAIYASSSDGSTATNIIIRYADIGGTVGNICASAADRGTTGILAVITGLDTWTISRCHIHNVSIPFLVMDADDWTVEYSHIGPSWAKEAISSQQTSGWTVRHNVFLDNLIPPPVACQLGGDEATADIWARETSGQNDGWKIYGNVFADSGDHTGMYRTNGIILGNYYGGASYTVSDWKVYNNIFYNIQGSQSLVKLGSGTGNVVANNLWYKSRTSNQTIGVVNAGSGASNGAEWCYSDPYDLCASSPGTWVVGSEDPFANSAGYDFRLKASFTGNSPQDVGTTIADVDAVDRYSATRGTDGHWDIGAYEYGGSPDTDTPDIVTAGNVTKVNTSGTTFTLVLDESVTVNDGTGFTLDCNGTTGEGLSYVSVSGATLTFNITGRVIASGETCTLDYATVANGVIDAASTPNALESIGDPISVYNGSTYSPSEASFTVTPSTDTGCSVSPQSAQSVPTGDTIQFTCTPLSNYNCVTWTGTCGGSGTTTLTTSAISGACTVIQPCFRKPGFIIGASGGSIGFGTGGSVTLSQ
jgi:hypothetical protein